MSDPIDAYFNHAQLSMAAYAILTEGMSNDAFKQALKNRGFSDAQASTFVSTYSIVSVFNDPATDFSATLFQKSGSSEKILAIRGTENWRDLLISDLQIGVFGLTNQYASLENFSAQILAQLQPADTLTVTGHSLGGFLAQAFTLDHQALVSHTYTYNSPGLGGILINPVGQLGITANPVPNSLITNLIAQGHSFVSSTGAQFGTPRDIFIETSINPFDNHGKGSITDSLALYDLFAKVDPNLSQNLSAITGILEAESSESANSLEKGLDTLRKLFGDSATTETPVSPPGDDPSSAARNTYYTNLISLRNGLPSGSFEVRSLIGQPTNVLTTQAQTEIAYRYALKELNPFVVLGANYTPHNETGELTEVNPDTGIGDLTPQYLIDRTAFLAKKIEVNSSIFTVPSSTYFKDNRLQEEIGSTMLPLPQMLFGNGSNEILTGSLFRADHLYGWGGDDQLLGQGGNDYLEGNRGDDTLDGGSGADTMLGGQGNDIYIVDNGGDVAREYANSGIDEVRSSVTFTLDSQVEKLTLTGTADINGTGNELNNTITGNDGINRLEGQGGTDHLIGGLGNDILAGGAGNNDLLEGGAGFDTYIYNAGDGTDQIEDSDATGKIVFNGGLLQGGISTDDGNTYVSLDGTETYVLSGGHLIVNGALTVNANFQSGQFGIQLRDVSEANYDNGLETNTFVGTPNDDTIVTGGGAGTRNALVNAGDGNDFVLASANNDQLFGEAGHDTLFGNSAQDRLDGGLGNDFLAGDNDDVSIVDGNDRLDGGDGDDQLVGGWGDDVLAGGAGTDTLYGDTTGKAQGSYTANDYLDGGDGDDELHGLAGDDVLFGGTGNDFLSGEEGNDIEDGGAGDDLLLAFTGNDSLAGGAGLDRLYGDQGNDILDGGDDADTLYGGDGSDQLYGGGGADIVLGDHLNNPSEFSTVGAADVLDGGAGNDHLEGGMGDDTLFGGSEHDVLFGDAGADVLAGDDGDDELQGGADHDTLFGDAGTDRLFGQAGDDDLAGGTGDDLLSGGDGHDFLDGEAGIDRLEGGAGQDILVGGAGSDTLLGEGDDDELSGDEGDDILNGGAGNNLLLGGDGHDQLIGGSGVDELDGGTGNDVLVGGVGVDTYVFHLGDGVDTIFDTPGEGNRLVFGPGITEQDISLGIGSLLIRVGSNGDAIHIQGFDQANPSVPTGIARFEFANGTTLTHTELTARGFDLVGTEGDDFLDGGETYQKVVGLGGNDVLLGGTENNVLDGGAGNDSLFSGEGQDTLLGGIGNDQLGGGAGADVLDGGNGNDRMEGGTGSDTYRFSIGSGFDQIADQAETGELNQVVFGSGISSTGLRYRIGSGLELPVGMSGEGLSLGFPNFFDIYNSQAVDQFQFADGTILTHTQLVDRGIDVPGTEFDDSLTGTNARDFFVGSRGDDQLTGGAGDDQYLFDVGDGIDTIADVAVPWEGNAVVFGLGITSADITLGWQAPPFGFGTNKLLLRVGTDGDALLMESFDRHDVLGPHAVDSFRFADGTVLSYSQLMARGFDITGTTGNDVLSGTNVTDRLSGLAGNDVLQGGDGDDVLDGGTGTDQLHGGRGNDIYMFGRGSGQDRLIDLGGTQDTIQLAANVAPGDVQVTKTGNDVRLTISDTGDSLTLLQFLTASVLQIDAVRFADGTIWDAATLTDLARRPIVGTAEVDTLVGTGGDDILRGLAGDDQLSALAGHDVLDGGAGADVMAGGLGDDTYLVDDAGDAIVEAMGEGLDTLHSSVTYQLSANVENLTLTGAGSVDAIGNALDNVLTGNGAANVLTGGAGDDTYVIGGGDTVIEQAGEGRDTVVADRTYALGATLENLTLAGSAPINGTGNELDNVLTGNSAVNMLTGGKGNDTYVVSAADVVMERVGEGVDTIQTTRSYRLGANVENLTLLETAAPKQSAVGAAFLEDETSIYGGTNAGSQSGIGNDSDNVLLGNNQANVLEGGPGEDTLSGNGGLDILRGGADQDTYQFGFGSGIDVIDDTNLGEIDTIQLEAGISPDQVTATRQQLFTDSPIYHLFPFASALSLALPNPDRNAGAPADQTYIIYSSLADFSTKQVRFSDGTIWDAATLLEKSAGPTDPGPGVIVNGEASDDVLIGSAANDQLNGFDGNDRLEGRAGNDILEGGEGHDVLLGGDGRDSLSGGGGDNELDGGEGDDRMSAIGEHNVLRGRAGNDFLTGQGLTNLLDGGPGSDALSGFGIDTFVFGRGYGLDFANPSAEDTIQLTPDVLPTDVRLWAIELGNHRLSIQGTRDELQMGLSFPGQVVFADGTVWDQGYLISHEQQFIGTDGQDFLNGTIDPDTLVGGKGDDFYGVTAGDLVIELPDEGRDAVGTLLDYALPEHVEDLYFEISSQAVLGIGNGLDNVIKGAPDHGGDGDNILDGGAGNDVLIGGASIPSFSEIGDGSDLLIGGPGNDVLRPFLLELGGPYFFSNALEGHGVDLLLGGPGDDTYILIGGYTIRSEFELTLGPFTDLPNATVIESPGEGSDTVVVINDHTLPAHVENLFLFGGTHGIGNELDNVLIGSNGSNQLEGREGNDTLIGGYGTSSHSEVLDDSTDDEMVDTLIGGIGNDLFVAGVGDVIVEQVEEGIDTVASRLSIMLGNNLEHLMLTGDVAIDGTGNALDNVLTGNSAANVLTGSFGNDTLRGGAGDDRYAFNVGDGFDTIQDVAGIGEGNRIRFGSGISQADLTFTYDNVARTLTIQVGSSGTDQLLLTNFDPTGTNGSLVVETLAFADGSATNLIDLFAPNHAPTVAVPLADQTVSEDAPFSVVVPVNTFVDEDAGETLTLSASLADGTALPAWLTFDATTATFSGTPDDAQVGNIDLRVTATDTGNLTVSDTFALTVTNVNEAPTVATPLVDQTALEDTAFSFTVPASTFADVDVVHGDALTYSAALAGGGALPTWLIFDSLTRMFSGTPSNSDIESLALIVTATDSGTLSASTAFTLTVQNINDTPTVAAPIADQTAAEDSPFSFTVPSATFTDPDQIHGDGLTYSAMLANGSALPVWLSFNPTTRIFSGTPGPGDAGTLQIAMTATDTGTLSATDTFALVVSGPLPLTLVGTTGNDVLIGGRGDDTLSGLAGNDTLNGGQGHDLLDGGIGTDTMQGGTGNDTYIVDVAGDVVTESANEGTDTVQSSITYTLGNHVENLTLTPSTSSGQVNGTGNALDNIILGNSANNTLNGGAGHDRLNGGLGADTMIGGTGDDTYVVNQVGDIVSESLNQGTDTVESHITFTLGSNVESLILMGTANINGTGSSANNVLVGNSGNNTLDSGSGNDRVEGGEGHDSLLGGSGDDQLLGGLGNDVLNAGSGNDSLNGGDGTDMLDGGSGDDQLLGGAGDDTMTGGSGADQFTGGMGNDTLTGGSGNDLYNFSRGDGQDTISDSDPFQGNQDRALFGATINPLDVVISRQANDLRLSIHGSSDQITVQNWYTSSSNHIETIQAGNSQTLLSTQVDQLIQAMAGFTQQTGLTWDQAIDQRPQDVQTILAASWQ